MCRRVPSVAPDKVAAPQILGRQRPARRLLLYHLPPVEAVDRQSLVHVFRELMPNRIIRIRHRRAGLRHAHRLVVIIIPEVRPQTAVDALRGLVPVEVAVQHQRICPPQLVAGVDVGRAAGIRRFGVPLLRRFGVPLPGIGRTDGGAPRRIGEGAVGVASVNCVVVIGVLFVVD